jgi:signal transduction histidine kinase
MRAVRWSLLAAGVALGVAGEWALYGWDDPGRWLPDLAAGWSMLGCGLVAWSRWPRRLAGVLLTTVGVSWFAGNFVTVDAAWVAWLSAHALFWYRGPLVHLVLSYPNGLRRSFLDRAAIAGAYVAAAVTPIWQSEIATIALAGCLVVVASVSYARAVGRERRERLAAWEATTYVALLFAGGAAAALLSSAQAVGDARVLAQALGLCVLAPVLLAGLIVRPWDRAAIADLVVELGEVRSGTLRTALARTVGDPTLQVGYWSGAAVGFVDEAGSPVELPRPGDGRAVTRIEREGQPVAALVHDSAVLDDPELVDALTTASGLAASHARLRAELRAQLVELQSSRRRLLRTVTDERRRLEERLHHGAERTLLELDRALESATARPGASPEVLARLSRAEEQLQRTIAQLRVLSQGLHPRALTEDGLAQALTSLCEQSPVPVELHGGRERLPVDVEAAVYFVCSEALANVAKYASASSASVAITVDDGVARVVIADDGVGGADAARGSGLRGLADRVETLGGTVVVESPPGRGTHVVAELPLDDRD